MYGGGRRGAGSVQVLGEETLGPGREEVVYTGTYAGPLQPGDYEVIGALISANRPAVGFSHDYDRITLRGSTTSALPLPSRRSPLPPSRPG